MNKYILTAICVILVMLLSLTGIGSLVYCFAKEADFNEEINVEVIELKPDDPCPPLEGLPSIEEPIEEAPPAPIVPYITLTEEEREMLARLTWLESGICSFDCQVAVVSVVINRLESGMWKTDMDGNGVVTLYDIIHYPYAFTPAYKIPYVEASQSCYDAVDYVLLNGPVFHNGVRYFRIDYDFSWSNYNNYCVIDNVYFGYFDSWENGGW